MQNLNPVNIWKTRCKWSKTVQRRPACAYIDGKAHDNHWSSQVAASVPKCVEELSPNLGLQTSAFHFTLPPACWKMWQCCNIFMTIVRPCLQPGYWWSFLVAALCLHCGPPTQHAARWIQSVVPSLFHRMFFAVSSGIRIQNPQVVPNPLSKS